MDKEFLEKIKEKASRIAKAKTTPRFKRVIGRLIASRLFQANKEYPSVSGPVPLKDFLWAGTIEPRVFEVLPAIVVKRPSLLIIENGLPADLAKVKQELEQNNPVSDFRGISPKSYQRWLLRVGVEGKLPSQLKTIRLQKEDIELLAFFKEKGLGQTAAIKQGLVLLKKSLEKT